VSEQTVVENGDGGIRGGGGRKVDTPTNSAIGPNHGREEYEHRYLGSYVDNEAIMPYGKKREEGGSEVFIRP
jgi:hypothetical protein